MEISWIQGLKYLGLFLTLGTAFAGTWFLDFTTPDKETSRKKFTKWGKRGIIFAAFAVVATLGATIWSDHDTSKKQAQATELQKVAAKKLEDERESTRQYQELSKKSTADIVALLEAIKSANLNDRNKAIVKSAVVSLSGIEDYKKYYPALYARIVQATTYNEFKAATLEGLTRAVNSRILEEPRCAGVPRASPDVMSGYPSGVFMLAGNAALSYQISHEDVKLTLTDSSELDSLNNSGYVFNFADGSNLEMNCSTNYPNKYKIIGISCEDSTLKSEVRQAFLQLQQKMVATVKTSKRKYDLSPEVAANIRNTLSCITP